MKGAKPEGTDGSVKFPESVAGVNFESKTSILLLEKFAARRKLPAPLFAIARPVYTAPEAELFATTTAFATLGFHAEIVPSSASKMKNAADPWERAKSVVDELKTIPVGDPVFPEPAAAGIVTTNCLLAPAS